MKNNNEILAERTNEYNKIQGARVGDFLKLSHGQYLRFAHEWPESLQTTTGGSFYLGNGYCSLSGSLDHGIDKKDIQLTDETRKGSVWFFDDDLSGSGRGVYFDIDFRVFEIKEGADTHGIPQIKEHEKQLIIDKAETITRINGNGQPYTLPLPEIHIIADELNDVYLKHMEDQTGLKFVKGGLDYSAQPLNNIQIVQLMTMTNWETTFYNNATWHNTLMLKFKRD